MQERARPSLRSFLRDAWSIARPYWSSDDRWRGRGLLAAIVGLNLGIVYLLVRVNTWYAAFYDALQNKDADAFWHQLGLFAGLATAYVAAAVYQLYLNQMLQIRWRTWLTEHSLDLWLRDRAYYRMQLVQVGSTGPDNPDQRIADDVKLFVALTLRLGLDLMRQVVTLFSFLAVLYTLSGVLELTLAGRTWSLPGYMVYAAILYALAGSWLTARIGRPLSALNFRQQRVEADFRFGLVRLRENAEGVALYSGEDDERRRFRRQFAEVVKNWWGIMQVQKRITAVTSFYGQAAVVFPFIMAAPRFFSGAIQLGGLMQTVSAFGRVQDALSYLVDSYVDIAEWRAVVERLSGFARAAQRAHADSGATTAIERGEGDFGRIALDGLKLSLPGGGSLLDAGDAVLRSGESALISGPSGAGKSTLFRALAGIWPFGSGRIELPYDARLFFLPQKPYLPIASLREVVLFPEGRADSAAIGEALSAVGLAALAGRLDEERNWAQELSPGEQQRIAFARALLQRPDWIFLDEATSALDETSEAQLYALLRGHLPDATVVSIGHRSTLAAFHARHIRLAPTSAGSALQF